MKVLLVIVAVACLLAPIFVQESMSQQEGKAPFMVSFADLKWVDLPERKGMQFAVLSAIPRQGYIRKFEKSLPGPTIRSIHIVARSRMWSLAGRGTRARTRIRPKISVRAR